MRGPYTPDAPDAGNLPDAGSTPDAGSEPDRPYAAIVLAGGGARRMGGRNKPALAVAGRSMLDRVLGAVADAARRVVVGPDDLVLPPEVLRTREHPPGGGPVAAIAAGLAALHGPKAAPHGPEAALVGPDAAPHGPEAALAGPEPVEVAVLAADLPLLDRAGIARLRNALAACDADVALFVDAEGRWQSLCAVWRAASLRARCAALGTPLAGRAIRDLLAGADVVPVSSPAGGPPPWFDCDTQDDLDRARSWLAAGGTGRTPAE